MLNGLAAKCGFGNQTERLVNDIFMLKMSKKQVQEKLCTEQEDNPSDALQFAIAFEDSLKHERTYRYIRREMRVMKEPVCTVSGSRQKLRECWRCGAGYFSLDHLKSCKGPELFCKFCGKKDNLERVCKQTRKDGIQHFDKFRANGNREQFNKRVQLVDQEEYDDDYKIDTVLNVEGDEENVKPYYLEGFKNRNRFNIIMDSGSLVTIFALTN